MPVGRSGGRAPDRRRPRNRALAPARGAVGPPPARRSGGRRGSGGRGGPIGALQRGPGALEGRVSWMLEGWLGHTARRWRASPESSPSGPSASAARWAPHRGRRDVHWASCSGTPRRNSRCSSPWTMPTTWIATRCSRSRPCSGISHARRSAWCSRWRATRSTRISTACGRGSGATSPDHSWPSDRSASGIFVTSRGASCRPSTTSRSTASHGASAPTPPASRCSPSSSCARSRWAWI